MTKVILNQAQSYISTNGVIKFGKKDSTVDVDSEFLNLIEGKYRFLEEEKEEEEETVEEKPIGKMNRNELIGLSKEKGVDISEEDLGKLTKAQIIELIKEA